MGHWNDARIAIEKHVSDNWGVTPVRYWSSGVPFAIPSTPYIAVKIEETDAEQVSLGDTPQLHRYHGLIIIQILVPERQGSKVASGYCDTLDNLFRRAQLSYGTSGVIVCRTPNARTVGVQDGWFQMNLTIPYKRDRVH